MSWGYVIYHEGRWIAEDCGIGGDNGTNNVAEYLAVIEALRYLAGCGLTRERVKIHSDSQLLINQITGYREIYSPHLELLYNEIKELERRFTRVGYQWLPREQNEHADLLSKLAYIREGV